MMKPQKTPAERAAYYELMDTQESRVIVAGDALTIFHIRGELAFGFPARDYVAKIERAKDISIFIDCVGGDVNVGLDLYHALAGKRVSVTVMGNCFSAAVLILCAAQERKILSTGRVMVHQPQGFHGGTASELHEVADRLNGTRQMMGDILRQRCPGELVEAWLADGDHYLAPAEALACGLVTEIIEPPAPLT